MSGPERSVRASDDDRERVALELGRQAGAGRLTAEELGLHERARRRRLG